MTRNRVLLAFCFSGMYSAFAMAQSGQRSKDPLDLDETTTTTTETTTTVETTKTCYEHKGVDNFFNIREANSDVKCGKWELELNAGWATFYSRQHRDDDIGASTSIKYVITDDLYVQLGVLPLDIGDGWDGTGNGDTSLQIFWQFLREQDAVPAMALWLDSRFPTGVGSEKIDVSLHMAVTKTICDNFRAHINGFVESANGYHGDPQVSNNDRQYIRNGIGNQGDEDDRRNFQWGAGPGLDYQINACNMLVLNYLNRSNNLYGHQNNNIIELGWVYSINECSYLKTAVDADTHADAGGAHWSAKVQYSISW
jgi:hypothetical protein